MKATRFAILAVFWLFLLTGCSRTADSGKGGPQVNPSATPGKGLTTDAPGKIKGQATVPATPPGENVAKDAPSKAKSQPDDPETIRKEVRDLLSGSKKGSAETLDARKKRIESITKEAVDEWTAALKTSREEAFTFLMNYDRLYTDNTFQKAESDRVQKLYEGPK